MKKTLCSLLLLFVSSSVYGSNVADRLSCISAISLEFDIFDPATTDMRTMSINTGFVTMKTAVFSPGSSERLVALQDDLQKAGVKAVVLNEPTESDRQTLDQASGYFYGPFGISQRQPTPVKSETADSSSLLESLLGKVTARTDLNSKKKARKKRNIKGKLASLHDSLEMSYGDFDADTIREWKKYVFMETVGARATGVDTVSDAYIDGMVQSKAEGKAVFQVVIREKESGKIVAASFAREKEQGVLAVERAAALSTEEYQNLSFKLFEQMVEIAVERGTPTLSYGTDYNNYGADAVSLGLWNFKVSIGFSPQKGEITAVKDFGKPRLIRFLNREKMGETIVTFVYSNPEDTESPLEAVVLGSPDAVSLPDGIEINDVFN